ncbi:MAG: hypothetical protein ACAH83_08220 [Alphaproteobacteria bacterium]
MTEWNPETEKLIRDLGDYLDKQMKDMLNPRASAAGTALRSVFRAVAVGKPLKRRMNKAGLTSVDYMKAMHATVELAEANSSDAGEKIKKILPVMEKLAREPDVEKGWLLTQIKFMKKYAKDNGIS